MTDTTIQRRATEEFDWDSKVEATHVGVSIKDGAVTLAGRVAGYSQQLAAVKATECEKRLAENAAKTAPGIGEIDNEIVVVP